MMFNVRINLLNAALTVVIISTISCTSKESSVAEQVSASKSAQQIVLATKAAVGDKLADEGQTFVAEQMMTVKYGNGTRFFEKQVSGTIRCENATFGDPAPGVLKSCFVVSISSSTMRLLATEGGNFTVATATTVRYGAPGKYVEKVVTGTVVCGNAVFGDPAPGVLKSCETSSSGAGPTPTPTPSPTPTPAPVPSGGDNAASAEVNLALATGTNLSGSVGSGGRGTPLDIVYDIARGSFARDTQHAEYGVEYAQNLGLVQESAPFYWMASFASAKYVNYITFGGAYSNQPQPNAMWKVQYRAATGAWVTLQSGKGGWINAGNFVWSQSQPIVTNAVRVIVYSDGVNPLVSIHLRGRSDLGSANGVLLQYRSGNVAPTPVPPPTVPTGAVSVILDTDMALDVDDVGALGMLHALADNGEANILAIMHNTGTPKSVGIIDAINTYYGRPNIPIGAYKGSYEVDSVSPYAGVADRFPSDVKSNSSVPDATSLYRKILASQPDRSVVVISVGFLTNLELLLKSGPDANSALTGIDLVNRKVKSISAMAGQFPSGGEFNLQWKGIGPTSKYVIDTLSVPIVFSGFEIGLDIHTGGSLINTPTSNPVRAGYELFFGSVRNRNSWDQTSVLYGVRGASFQGREYWKLRSDGYTAVRSDGFNEWITGSIPANKKHSYLLKSMSNEELANVIDGLMSQAPKNK